MKKIVILSLPMLMLLGFLFHNRPCNLYYECNLSEPPQELIRNALKRFDHPGQAIDLGCGVGNEAILLIKEGWKVIAIDAQESVIEIASKRQEVKNQKALTTLVATFDDSLSWNLLPQADFLYASYSLPFCKKEAFPFVWEQVEKAIAPGGRFAGHFFGKEYRGFDPIKMQKILFWSEEEVLSLFQNFEIEFFHEVREDSPNPAGEAFQTHIFEVIARKKSDPAPLPKTINF